MGLTTSYEVSGSVAVTRFEARRTTDRSDPNGIKQIVTLLKVEMRPCEATFESKIARFMKVHGLIKRPRRGPVHSPGAQANRA